MTSKAEENGDNVDQEALRLLSQTSMRADESEKTKSDARAARQMTRLLSMSLFIVCSLAVILSTFINKENPIIIIRRNRNFLPNSLSLVSDSEDIRQYPELVCPAVVRVALNAADASFGEEYTDVSEHIIESNITDFIENFRNEQYDAWGKTYNEVKRNMTDWKIKHYANNLKDGDTIFESAMGIGLNALLTLEAVQQVKQLNNVRVYGNEYIAESVYLANELLPTLLPRVNASMGTVCQGDSSNLRSFVPADSMDLVFCGYISTLINPLNFEAHDQDELDEMYDYICNSTEDDWEAKKLAEVAQERQNAWFGNWVAEMVRIAKPGAAVIVEEVSLPYCNDPDDWGGVPREYWHDGIADYGWDIDPRSIEMESDKVFGHERYHVFMRKNNPMKIS